MSLSGIIGKSAHREIHKLLFSDYFTLELQDSTHRCFCILDGICVRNRNLETEFKSDFVFNVKLKCKMRMLRSSAPNSQTRPAKCKKDCAIVSAASKTYAGTTEHCAASQKYLSQLALTDRSPAFSAAQEKNKDRGG